MKRVRLPGTTLEVSQLCFGCWGLTTDFHWGERDAAESVAAIEAALDGGIDFFDTAAVYADGESEKLLGKTLGSRRGEVVVASKVRPDESMRPEKLAASCEASLRRLGTDYLDLYQIHWSPPDWSMADVWESLLRLREAGKIRHAGVCNFGVERLREIGAIEHPVTNQIPYNLLWRAIEDEIIPYGLNHQIGVLAYSPLMHGLLADKYAAAVEVPDGRARSRHFSAERALARHGEPGCEEETFATIGRIRQICQGLGRSMADVALAYIAAKPGVTSVIVGVRNAEQLRENAATLANPLPAEAIAALDDATAELKQTLGPNPDMWQGAAASRYR